VITVSWAVLPPYPEGRLRMLQALAAWEQAARPAFEAWLVRRSYGWEWLGAGPLLPWDPHANN
jgi:hypothetical protein